MHPKLYARFALSVDRINSIIRDHQAADPACSGFEVTGLNDEGACEVSGPAVAVMCVIGVVGRMGIPGLLEAMLT